MIIIGIILLLFLILLIRTCAFKPITLKAIKPEFIEIDGDTASLNLSRMIRKRTVSSRIAEKIEKGEFTAFINLLPELYPETHKVLEREIVNEYAMLYHWKGIKVSDPLVLMAHYDVVAAPDEGWEHPPFSGDIENGVVWGRGTLDTKGSLASALEAVEHLVKSGFIPKQDVYLSFSYDEEVDGVGTEAIVSLLYERGITPGLVVDEGGAVVHDIFPGIRLPIAVIGVAEKGITDVEIIVRGTGGHASTPPVKGAAYKLARAIMRIEEKPFKAFFPRPTLEMFDKLGRYTPFGFRMIFANMWLFKPLLLQLFKMLNKETQAMCRTTVAITMLEGSMGANVLPARVKAAVNIRVAVGSTVKDTMNHLKKAVHDPDVKMDMIYPGEPSPVSDTDETYDFLGQIINETWPGIVVSPYVMLGASDSRHYARITNHVYRFSPFELSKTELDSMHAVNERIPVSTLKKGVEFYIRLIKKS